MRHDAIKQKLLLVVIGLYSLSLSARAQGDGAGEGLTSDAVISQILQNNTYLKAQRDAAAALTAEQRTALNWEAPEVELTSFYGIDDRSFRRQDWAVTQTIDWDLLTGARRRVVKQQSELSDLHYQQECRVVRREAMRRLVQVVYYNRFLRQHGEQLQLARQVEAACAEAHRQGNATALDLSKARLSAALLQGEMSDARAQRQTLLGELKALNGGHAVQCDDVEYAPCSLPADFAAWVEQVAGQDPLLRSALQQVEVSKAELRQTRLAQIPHLSVGYASERAKGESIQGFRVGLAVPVWGARREVKRSKAQLQAAQSEQADQHQQLLSQLEALHSHAITLRQSVDDYRQALQGADSSPLLGEALRMGSITLLDYLAEKSAIDELRDRLLQAECDYQLAVTELLSYQP